MRINLFHILSSLSGAVDLVVPELANHHHQVAYLAYRLAQQLHWPVRQQRDILIAGMLHDIGALSVQERLSLIEAEPVTANSHAFRGAKLLSGFSPFASLAPTVRYHHVPWGDGKGAVWEGKAVPAASHLLHLADRACVLFDRSRDALSQVAGVLAQLQAGSGTQFVPEMVEALTRLGPKEYVWLELTYKDPLEALSGLAAFEAMDLELDGIAEIAGLFSHIIDFRSRFTATHSAGVAKTSEKLGELAGMSREECRMLLVAGYLHDLGKLTIDNAVLEKPAKLDAGEYNAMHSHTFYTYRILEPIKGFETINRWASNHHEKLDGSGYPFHLTGERLPLGSRILAVADIFTAITEHRAYRVDMEKGQIIATIGSMRDKGHLCPRVVAMLLDNFDTLTDICLASQRQAAAEYEQFLHDGDLP